CVTVTRFLYIQYPSRFTVCCGDSFGLRPSLLPIKNSPACTYTISAPSLGLTEISPGGFASANFDALSFFTYESIWIPVWSEANLTKTPIRRRLPAMDLSDAMRAVAPEIL